MTAQAHDIGEQEIALGMDARSIRNDFIRKLFFELAKFPGVATPNDHYLALAYVVRDRMMHRWVRSARSYLEGQHRTVVYLSAEYLLGPQLARNVLALDIQEEVREAITGLGLNLDEILEHEEEPGLGNGGLGRLAACYMDSLATLSYPAIGHGIRYEFGIFDQEIRDGWQIEKADHWLRLGNPWEIRRWDIQYMVGLGGHTEHSVDEKKKLHVQWVPERVVRGVPYDTVVLGHGTGNANFLRLWSAVAADEFDLGAFQEGQYVRSVEAKVRSENITKVLYPADETPAGKQLRLEQEYFFVSCALQDCLRLLHQKTGVAEFGEKFAIQLNDTHPTLAVPELMRLLMDTYGMGWDAAWTIVLKTFSYTNHTLLPEALETWSLPLFARLLPRHLEIIYEMNHRFLEEVRAKYPGDEARAQRMSLIDERGERAVRMAHVATVASHKINGVAALHSQLLRETVLRDFAEFFPERFLNVTNGITPRRFLQQANPDLGRLLSEAIGDGWKKDLDRLQDLLPMAEDAAFREKFRTVKRLNKEHLAQWLSTTHGMTVDPTSLFDAQCKRIHEYKRQHLNVLHAVWLYLKIRRGERPVKRTIMFAGKAAPAYRMAKLIIRLINGVAQAIERDVSDHLRVVFVPDFNVKNAQRIYPAADLSEQISTAGMEASGTGNMKFALNGALTIGTLDGANIEIRDAVGPENFFLFGLTAAEVAAMRPHYRPEQILADDPELTEVVAALAESRFSDGERGLFDPIVRSLVERDPFFVLADFRAYIECQERVAKQWNDREAWTRAAVRNVASMGRFSSDRSIREYASEIWNVEPVIVPGLRARPDL